MIDTDEAVETRLPVARATELGVVGTLTAAISACGGGSGKQSAGTGTAAKPAMPPDPTAPTTPATPPPGQAAPPVQTNPAPPSNPNPKPPADPPPVLARPETDAQAARFLLQAQFSATPAAITALRTKGYQPWLSEQMNRPQETLAWDWVKAQSWAVPSNNFPQGAHYMAWAQLLTRSDEVRMRVAFALSEIFVVSISGVDGYTAYAMAQYWDILSKGAFGNFRTMLEEITLNPAMGQYLSSRDNLKEDASKGRYPDENYAREVMQLFSIGLYELEADGTPLLKNGKPVETYNQDTIRNLARVFTGLVLDETGHSDGNPTRIRNAMRMDASRHSTLDVNLFDIQIPGSTPPLEKLRRALDILFQHPNVGPFIGRQLIQRLVVSNPSPAYVKRVAQAFNANADGVRGDMKSVITAVLLDPEARSNDNLANPLWGKVREPVVRHAQWARTFGIKVKDDFFNTDNATGTYGQTPLGSESVFNFFRPGYVPPQTAIAAQQMQAPEFQIINESTIASSLNGFAGLIKGWGNVYSDYDNHLALAANPQQLVDQLNLTLSANQLSATTVNLIRDTIATSATDPRHRLEMAITLVMACPEYLVQK